MNMNTGDQPTDYYKVYEEYAKNLRTWFVAYGIGGPVLFITNSDVASAISASPHRATIIWLFFLAVGFQIFLSGLNKYVNWILYAYHDKEHWRGNLAAWISDQLWIDGLLDVATVTAFGVATILTINIFV